MLFQSQIISRGSGSIGGLTASHNAGGNYLRARVTPVNPATPQQVEVRTLVAQLVSQWVNTLTEAQRVSWATYALNVPLLNPFGEPRNVSALNMFVRSNVPRLQAGFPGVTAAPTIFDLGDFTPVTAIGSAGSGLLVAFTAADAWANENDAGLLIYQSRTNNPSINFFKGPYRFAASIDGDAVTPPTSPDATIPADLPFVQVLANRTFYRVRVTRADGRLSTSQAIETTTIA